MLHLVQMHACMSPAHHPPITHASMQAFMQRLRSCIACGNHYVLACMHACMSPHLASDGRHGVAGAARPTLCVGNHAAGPSCSHRGLSCCSSRSRQNSTTRKLQGSRRCRHLRHVERGVRGVHAHAPRLLRAARARARGGRVAPM
eukprot:353518-Chlamydomonas_euryale.AAC.5